MYDFDKGDNARRAVLITRLGAAARESGMSIGAVIADLEQVVKPEVPTQEQTDLPITPV